MRDDVISTPNSIIGVEDHVEVSKKKDIDVVTRREKVVNLLLFIDRAIRA